MPEQLKQSDLKHDPTVTKQWDDEKPTTQKYEDFGAIADKLGVCMMSTSRESIGVSIWHLANM